MTNLNWLSYTLLTQYLTIISSHESAVGASKAGFVFGKTFSRQPFCSQPHNSEIRQRSALCSVLSPMVSSLPTTSFQNNNPLGPSKISLLGSSWTGQDEFAQLFHHLGATPNGLLRLEATEDGMRGLYLNRDVKRGESILMVPLASCLCDNMPPTWLTAEDDEYLISNSNSGCYDNPSSWATRLAASLLDLQLRGENSSMGQRVWLSLLPDKNLLRASLPVHWDCHTLQAAHCTALELAVDSAYFARAQAVSELLAGLQNSESLWKNFMTSHDLERLCHDALDVVQTRSCRLEIAYSDAHGQTLRVLAPIFDFINHGTSHRRGTGSSNACFGFQMDDSAVDIMQAGFLVVSAIRDIGNNEELLIDYGISARPAWKCLVSYGFVPSYRRPQADTMDSLVSEDDEEEEAEDDENLAEVYLDGVRYEVGPSTIPYEMVEATEAVIRAESFPNTPLTVLKDSDQKESSDEARLSPEIAIRISKRISDVAYKLLLQTELPSDEENDNDDGDDDDDDSSTPEQLLSAKLAASLRWSQHNVLLACALGLQDWAVQS